MKTILWMAVSFLVGGIIGYALPYIVARVREWLKARKEVN